MLATLPTDNPHTRDASCSSSAAMQSAFALGADALPTPPATMPTPPNQLPPHVDASAAKKRKRTDSEEPRPQLASKRPRVADDVAKSAANNTRGSTRSTPIPTTGRKHKVPLPAPPPVQPLVRANVIQRPCTATADGNLETMISCFDIVQKNVHNFKQFFTNPGDFNDQSWTPEYLPYVWLEYPNTGAREKYLLLEPKDPDHWHPIRQLIDTVRLIAQWYIPPDMVPNPLGHSDQLAFNRSEPTKPSTGPGPSQWYPAGAPPRQPAFGRNLLRSMDYAFKARNGPRFVKVIEDVNRVIRGLKEHPDGTVFTRAPARWGGVPPQVNEHIYEEVYQRSAGPRVKEITRRLKAFSSTTYGELNCGLITEMVNVVGLKPGMTFFDLGSGIGNVVIQAALVSGCSSYGIEIVDVTNDVAQDVSKVFLERCRLWGLEAGPQALYHGDFRDHEIVRKHIAEADVILANNFVFTPKLNEALRTLFLDLKEGAKVISLKSFKTENSSTSKRNLNDVASIFDVTQHDWVKGDVSWGDGTGHYYISTVNRSRLGEMDASAVPARVRDRSSRRKPIKASERQYKDMNPGDFVLDSTTTT